MRVCSMFMSVKRKRSAIFFRFAQRQVAFVELVIGQALVDQVADELLDLLRGRLFQRARGALHHVGQADDRALAGLRFRAAVAKTFLRALRECLPRASS